MDELSGKRCVGGLVLSRKSPSLISRDITNNSKQDAQFCNRIGCSGRLKYSKTTTVSSTEKPKYSKPAFRNSSDNKSVRVFRHKPVSGCQNVQPGPSVSSSSSSSSSGAKSNSHGSKYGLKNLKCNSISDVIPQASSRSESKVNKRDGMKRSPEGESSSSLRGTRSSSITYEERRFPLSTTGISISSPRRTRPPSNDSSTAAARSRRSLNANTRMRFSNLENFNVTPRTQSTPNVLVLSQPDTEIDPGVNSLSNQSNDLSSYSTSDSSSDDSPSIMPLTSVEQGVTHALRRYNLDGVAEMLMALERIEQDEEMSYEEEYVIGDEIGKLACQHGYHGQCIQQWLRLKNWCPICKSSVAPSSSSSPS
ncbi:hypothetical protein M9H77_32642 [Catharanthus roseus]|uniref:Uncharacterized protein n=1 Tax=Catharanthus roseus TaxID=4058 RepID=A0ACC0A4Y5_CATRO|nr:hypothetical protein M9H77_32642 [Catharanthus roseus]